MYTCYNLGVNCNSLYTELAQTRIELPCCKGPYVKLCQPVAINITKLGDQKLQLGIIEGDLDFVGPVGETSNSFMYANDNAEVTITEHNGDIYGHASLDNGEDYDIEYCGNNIHVVKQMDRNNMPGTKHVQNDEVGIEGSRIGQPAMRTTDTTTIVTFSVKFYYTPQFAAVTADIDGFINQAIAVTNQGFINSKAPLRVQSCGSEKTTIDEVKKNEEMWSKFNSMKGSAKELRGTADAAALLVADSDVCGLGNMDATGNGGTITLNAKGCVMTMYVLGHELGHNFGLGHNKEQGPNESYPEGLGYLLPGGKYMTIQAYSSKLGEKEINYYSNPDVVFPKTGQPTGIKGSSNSVKVLTEKRFAMAALGDESQCTTGKAPTTTATTGIASTSTATTEDYNDYNAWWNNY